MVFKRFDQADIEASTFTSCNHSLYKALLFWIYQFRWSGCNLAGPVPNLVPHKMSAKSMTTILGLVSEIIFATHITKRQPSSTYTQKGWPVIVQQLQNLVQMLPRNAVSVAAFVYMQERCQFHMSPVGNFRNLDRPRSPSLLMANQDKIDKHHRRIISREQTSVRKLRQGTIFRSRPLAVSHQDWTKASLNQMSWKSRKLSWGCLERLLKSSWWTHPSNRTKDFVQSMLQR